MLNIDISVLHGEAVTDYLACADRRAIGGFRTALEFLNIPLPIAALRKPDQRRGIRHVMQSYHADNPVEAIRDNQERLSAGNETSKAQQAARSNGEILNSLDPSALLKGSDDNAR